MPVLTAAQIKAAAKYRKSAKGKATRSKWESSSEGRASLTQAASRYRQTPKGRRTHAKGQARYAASPMGGAYMAEYAASPAVKAYKARYAESADSKASRRRYNQTNAGKIVRHRHHSKRRARSTDYEGCSRRYRQMLRDKEPCVRCGLSAEQVDHILPLALGGTDDWDNLQPLCKSCHKAKTREDLRLIRKKSQ